MKRVKLGSFFSVLFLSLLAIAGIVQPVTSAATRGDRGDFYGYFYNQYSNPGAWYDDVIAGGIPDTADKGTFINFITDKYYNGSEQDKTGAAFIINLQLGNSGSGSNRGLAASDINGWATRIQQPQVTFSMEDYTYNYNSAYNAAQDDDFFYPDTVNNTRHSLVIRYNGIVVSAIKQDCANPLDGNSGIPNAPPPPPPPSALQGFVLEENTANLLSANVSVSGVGTESGQNPFFFADGHSGHHGSFSSGSHAISVTGVPTGYTVVGSTICGGSSPCASGQPASNTSGQNFAAGASRTFNFAAGATYDIRWILRRQVTLSCITPTLNPAAIEPTTTYTVQIGANVQPAAMAAGYAAIATATVSVVGPGVNYTATPALTASGSTVTATVTPGPTNNTGTYGISFTITGAWGSVTCGTVANPIKTFPAAYAPYFRAQGGNVLAGVGFGTACTPATGNITSWNKYTGAATPYYGAGTDLAAIALGQIKGFVSSNNQDGTTATNGTQAPNGLTLANTTANVAAGIYGGAYGVTNWCMPDYAGDAAAEPGATAGTTVDAAIAGANGTYTLTGNQTLSATTLSAGKRITIVITGGNLTITGDVTYSYALLADIPQLQIFVKGGNINITPGVHNLSGVYGAEKSAAGVGGQIDTCAGVAWNFANCNSSLTFYGTVFADKILLKRMAGTVSNPTTSAETFVYGPETWLGRNFAVPDTAWESATSLSPIL